MNLDLIKAIYAAGYRLGYQNGENNCASFERGNYGSDPDKPEKSWDSEIKWRLESESYKLDINNPKDWDDV